MKDTGKEKVIQDTIKKYHGEYGGILSILEEIQSKYGYLSADALKLVSAETGRSMVDIYGIATFYKAFTLTPRGKHIVSVCVGTACHVRGAPAIADEFKKRLGIKAGETTTDKEFTLETVNCLGACALGPIVVVDGHYYSNVKRAKVQDIIDKTRTGIDKVEVTTDERIFPIDVSCPRCNHSFMDKYNLVNGHPSISVTVSAGQKHGWMRLSSLYGSYSVESAFPLPKDETIDFFCPYCHAELTSSTPCPECGASMVPMIVKSGGIVEICSRRGCKGHMLDLSGANA